MIYKSYESYISIYVNLIYNYIKYECKSTLY